MASKKKENNKNLKKAMVFKNEVINRQIIAVLLAALAAFMFAGIKFTSQTGYFGIILNNIFRTLLGDAALALPFLLAILRSPASGRWKLKIFNTVFWDWLFFFTPDDIFAFNIIIR